VRRCLKTSPGARKSKSPWPSAHDQPARVSAAPSASGTKGTTSERTTLIAGEAWEDNDLAFCTRIGTALEAGNVRRAFRAITKAAGIGEDWTPRELRHSFVSILSDNEVPIETIADLCGHKSTIVTQKVYRHQLKPVITKGAVAMNTIFATKKTA